MAGVSGIQKALVQALCTVALLYLFLSLKEEEDCLNAQLPDTGDDGIAEGEPQDYRAFSARSLIPKTRKPTTPQCLLEAGLLKNGSLVPDGYMMVSEKYKFVVCLTPKGASSSFLQYFRWIHMWEEMCHNYRSDLPQCSPFQTPSNETKSGNRTRAGGKGEGLAQRWQRKSFPNFGFSFIDDYSLSKQVEILNSPDYFKFTIHRHPWGRLESGYRSKYLGSCDLNATCILEGTYAIPAMERFIPQIGKQNYSHFEAFVDGITASSPLEVNKHWKPQSYLCGHDCVNYDEMIDLKHAEKIDDLAERLNLPRKFSEIALPYQWSNTKLSYTVKSVAKAWDFYRVDALRWGYDFQQAFEGARDYDQLLAQLEGV